MDIESAAAGRLAKGLVTKRLFDPFKNKKGKDKSGKEKKTTVSAKVEKPAKPESATKTKKESAAGASIPLDMKPEPIGLSNTSSLPAVNLGGMGTRSKQFKGQ